MIRAFVAFASGLLSKLPFSVYVPMPSVPFEWLVSTGGLSYAPRGLSVHSVGTDFSSFFVGVWSVRGLDVLTFSFSIGILGEMSSIFSTYVWETAMGTAGARRVGG